MWIFKEITFDSAHFLPNVPGDHKCHHMHGHTYRLTVWLEGTPNETGWLMDFSELKSKLIPVISLIDHKVLNDVPGLANPTCELLSVWLWDNLKPSLPLLKKIELHETPTSGVIYEGD